MLWAYTGERSASCWLAFPIFSASTFSSLMNNMGAYSNRSVQHDAICIQNSNILNWSPTITGSKITTIQLSKCCRFCWFCLVLRLVFLHNNLWNLRPSLSTDMAQEMCRLGAFVTNSKAKWVKISIMLNLDELMRWPVEPDKQDC